MKMKQKSRNVCYITGICVLVFCAALAGGFLKWRQHGKAAVTIQKLQVCHLTNPLGLDEEVPVFSWQMKAPGGEAVRRHIGSW